MNRRRGIAPGLSGGHTVFSCLMAGQPDDPFYRQRKDMKMQNMDTGRPDETEDTPVVASGTSDVLASMIGADEAAIARGMVASDTPIAESRPTTTYPMVDLFGSAKALLLGVHHAAESGEPLRGVQLHSDDSAMLRTLVEIAYVTRDAITDKLGITTNGRLFVGLKPEGVLDLPVEVAEITGNIEESELAARYCEGKIAAIDKAISMGEAPKAMMQVSWEESYQHCALTLQAMAAEFRMGLHIPVNAPQGSIIGYNEDRSTGISHRAAITMLCEDVHQRNVQAGWWNDLTTGEPLDRNPGELIALCHSELSEALEGVRKSLMDDHLPHRKMEEVEMADCVIRIADYCGGRGLDLGGAIDDKLAYNAQRADHKPENRVLADGKKI
jgi:hypothetical protein